MKKYLIFFLIFFSFQLKDSAYEQISSPAKKTPPTKMLLTNSPKKEMAPPVPEPQRHPAQNNNASPRPKKFEHLVRKDSSIVLETDDWVLTNISAISSDQYSSHLGPLIYKDNHFSYFEGHSDDATAAVFDPLTQKFHPLSQILMIKKINEDLRQEFLRDGHKEYYYHQRMKLLSIESTPRELLTLYKELKNRGLDVHLEVIKEAPRPR